MSLEVYTGKIADMVATNPTGTDPKSQGDDHIRGIKYTIQQDAVRKTGSQTMEGGLTISGGGLSAFGNVSGAAVFITGAQQPEPSSATRKDYVDGQDALKVNKAGDTMAGNLTAPGVVFPNAPTDPGANVLDCYREQGSYPVTATPASGAFADAVFSGQYVRIGKHVTFCVSGAINNVGSGSGALDIILPFPAAQAFGCAGILAEAGTAIVGLCVTGASTMRFYKYDGTAFLANGVSPQITISYLSS